jgi:hypothetical protein
MDAGPGAPNKALWMNSDVRDLDEGSDAEVSEEDAGVSEEYGLRESVPRPPPMSISPRTPVRIVAGFKRRQHRYWPGVDNETRP